MKDHRRIDQRSLAFGRAIAARLPSHPEHVDRARETLARWQKTCSPRSQSTLREWEAVLNGPLDGVIALLTGEDERSIRLRQSNPFAGLLTEQERSEILRRFESYESAST